MGENFVKNTVIHFGKRNKKINDVCDLAQTMNLPMKFHQLKSFLSAIFVKIIDIKQNTITGYKSQLIKCKTVAQLHSVSEVYSLAWCISILISMIQL